MEPAYLDAQIKLKSAYETIFISFFNIMVSRYIVA
jgi:hypothetical protein